MNNPLIVFFVSIISLIYSSRNSVPEKQGSAFNWCSSRDSILCLGDSFTWGPVGEKYPTALARLMGKSDTAVVNSGVGGETSTQIKQRFQKNTVHTRWNLIVWAGRNNVWEKEKIMSDIDSMVAGKKKYLVLEVLNGNWISEQKGTAFYDNLTATNEALARKHGKHFVWLKEYLQKFSNGTPTDSICVARGGVPQSLIVPGDSLHLAGNGNVHVAEKIRMQLESCKGSGSSSKN